jgi:uncharacterized repeat protein (TIGR03803 family)
MMVGCSGMPTASSVPSDSPSLHRAKSLGSSSFQLLHTFTGVPDGNVPVGALIDLDGVLYSTTNFGGDTSKNCSPGDGCGTVYQVQIASDTESVIYRFKAKAKGLRPYAGLTDVNGTLYGTTQVGGKHNQGTVFTITPSGSENVVHSFAGEPKDGAYPRAELTDVNGVLYGTTYEGGTNGLGTVFSITTGTTGSTEQVLHSFQGGADGAEPLGNVIEVNGTIYGTTLAGGAYNDGTVFAISGSGQESVLHSFKGKSDGAQPFAGLIDVNGTLYGTTEEGGTHSKGTVFAITTSGGENVVYSFAGGTDSAFPYAGLTLVNGQIYGVASHGGTDNDGTIYTVTPSGGETPLYSFNGKTDGAHPYANLIGSESSGSVYTLYGTTNSGGTVGDGTVFGFTL